MKERTGFYAVLKREIRRIPKFKGIFAVVTLCPLFICLLFFAIFFKGVPQNMPTAVYDGDNSPLSRKLVRMIDATASSDVLYNVGSVEEGRELMMKGKVDAVLVIPKGMENDIYKMEQVKMPFYVSTLKILNASLLYKDIFTTVSTFSSGIEIQFLMKGGLSEKEAYEKILPVYYDRHSLFNPYISYGYFLLPGFLLLMISMFSIISTVFVVGIELKRRTDLEWLETSGGNIVKALSGKIVPYTLLYYMLFLVCFAIMYGFMGQPLQGNGWAMLLLGVLFVVACQSFGVIIISIFGNLGLSTSLSAGLSIMAFSFSGLTFTIEAMYPVIQLFSNMFPYKHFTQIFVDQSVRGAGLSYSKEPIFYLCAFIVIALLMSFLLKRNIKKGSYSERELLCNEESSRQN